MLMSHLKLVKHLSYKATWQELPGCIINVKQGRFKITGNVYSSVDLKLNICSTYQRPVHC